MRITKRLLFGLIGYFLCVVPPAVAILDYFPVFAAKGGEFILSGIGLLLLLLAAVPLRRGLKRALRRFLASPSAFGIWGLVWLLTAWFGRIAAAIADIALVGFLSSLLGAIFFRMARREESV